MRKCVHVDYKYCVRFEVLVFLFVGVISGEKNKVIIENMCN